MSGNPEFAARLAADHDLLEQFRRDPAGTVEREGFSLSAEDRIAINAYSEQKLSDQDLVTRVSKVCC
jgi:hypothetical protein